MLINFNKKMKKAAPLFIKLIATKLLGFNQIK